MSRTDVHYPTFVLEMLQSIGSETLPLSRTQAMGRRRLRTCDTLHAREVCRSARCRAKNSGTAHVKGCQRTRIVEYKVNKLRKLMEPPTAPTSASKLTDSGAAGRAKTLVLPSRVM